MMELLRGAGRWACEGLMIVLRCTQRLLRVSKIVPGVEPPASTAALGEWYVNVVALPFRGRTLVAFVHSGTLLSVLAPGRVLGTTVPAWICHSRGSMPRPLHSPPSASPARPVEAYSGP